MAKTQATKRVRVTIEIDMPKNYRPSHKMLDDVAETIATNTKGRVVYLATEEVGDGWSTNRG